MKHPRTDQAHDQGNPPCCLPFVNLQLFPSIASNKTIQKNKESRQK